jgi:hypothetical protein
MSVSEPSKILTPWATSGLKNPIPPAANPVTGNAGYDQGFPAINMTAKEAGGIPPFGQDFNGILFSITEILRYIQAGGLPTFSSSLAAAAGGYGKGAVVVSDDGTLLYFNTVNGNTSNPNSGGSGWSTVKFSFGNNGYIALPSYLGGFIIQWVTRTTGNMTAGTEEVASGAWPIPFPISLFGVFGSARRTVTVGAAFTNPDTYVGTQLTNFSSITRCVGAGKFDTTLIAIGR